MTPSKILCFFFGLLPLTAGAQDACTTAPSGTYELAANAVSVKINTGGDIGFDGNNAGYFVRQPGGGGAHTLFAGALWMFAQRAGGGIQGAAQQYGRGAGYFDYGPGPLTAAGEMVENCADWDRFWPVKRAEVEAFLTNFDPANPDPAAVPASVLSWPGRGNPFFAEANGFTLPDRPQGYAPFVDTDGDGIYNPFAGDYPAFCGTEAAWCIFNDIPQNLDSALPGPLVFEAQLLAYAFTGTDDADPVARTTFYDYQVTNLGTEHALKLRLGHWFDFDVGCFVDDVVGSLPEQNAVYVHNASALDQPACPAGVASFSQPGAVQIAQYVAGERTNADDPLLASVVTLFNPPLGNPAPGIGDPQGATQYYNVADGRWRDSTALTRGGLGYDQPGPVTRFAFDGGPTAAGTDWRGCTDLPVVNFEHRVVMMTRPPDLPPGGKTQFTLAMTTIFDVTMDDDNCPAIGEIAAAAETVRQFHDDGGCERPVITSSRSYPLPAGAFVVSPNPNRGRFTLGSDRDHRLRRLVVTDAAGRVIIDRKISGLSAILVDDANLSPGVHHYRVTTVAGRAAVGKFVVHR